MAQRSSPLCEIPKCGDDRSNKGRWSHKTSTILGNYLRVNPTSLRCSLFLRPDPKWIRLGWSSQATSRSRREPQVPTALNISQSCRRGAQSTVCNARRKKSKSAFGRRVCFSNSFAGVKCREEKCPLGQLLHHLANIKMKMFFSM